MVAEAHANVDATLAAAQREADVIGGAARAGGESDAAAVLAAERARVRGQARAVVLAAQREAYDELRSQVARATPVHGTTPVMDRGGIVWSSTSQGCSWGSLCCGEPAEGGVLAEANGRRGARHLGGTRRPRDRLDGCGYRRALVAVSAEVARVSGSLVQLEGLDRRGDV